MKLETNLKIKVHSLFNLLILVSLPGLELVRGLLALGLELLLLEAQLLLGRLRVEGLVLLVLPRLLVRQVAVRHKELVVHLTKTSSSKSWTLI